MAVYISSDDHEIVKVQIGFPETIVTKNGGIFLCPRGWIPTSESEHFRVYGRGQADIDSKRGRTIWSEVIRYRIS